MKQTHHGQGVNPLPCLTPHTSPRVLEPNRMNTMDFCVLDPLVLLSMRIRSSAH